MLGKICSYCWCFRRRYTLLQTSENINFSLFKNNTNSNYPNQITFSSESSSPSEKESILKESIFDKKFLTIKEQKIQFSFTKKGIINYIESQINNKTDFEPLISKNGFDIFINKNGSVFNEKIPMIKMIYNIPASELKEGINIKDIDSIMNEPEKRMKWDKTLKDYKIIEGNKENYILHYVLKSPMIFVSERDVIDKRLDFYNDDVYYDFSSSVSDNVKYFFNCFY
jgi:hypothetical protein